MIIEFNEDDGCINLYHDGEEPYESIPIEEAVDAYHDMQRIRNAVEELDWYHIHNNNLVQGANSADHIPLYKASDIFKIVGIEE